MSAAALCSLRDVGVRVGGDEDGFALSVPRLELRAGDRVALVSPSGSGKSLCLELLALVRRPDRAARFALGGEDVAAHWRCDAVRRLTRLRRRRIGFLLQSGGLLPFLTVRENVALPARLARTDTGAALARLGPLHLAGKAQRYPRDLSGGERQRAALARAIASSPMLLLADEPTASLDPRNADIVMGLLALLAEAGDVGAVVVATHDAPRAERFGFELLGLDVAQDAAGGISTVAARC